MVHSGITEVVTSGNRIEEEREDVWLIIASRRSQAKQGFRPLPGGVWLCNRVHPRGVPQIGICNGVQNSRCLGNTRKTYIGCPHPH